MAKCLVVLCLLVVSALAATASRIRIDPDLSWRVIGGKPADDGAYPHHVSLQYRGSHSCGAVIVDKEWVITAAHCVDGRQPSNLQILAGTNRLSQPGKIYKVLEVYYHEDYDRFNIKNDVGIMKVEEIEFSEKIGKIHVETEFVGGDELCTVSGWGTMRLGGPTPDILQDIDLKTTTVEYCQSRHGLPVANSEVCTLTKAGEGVCHGDSGSALIRTVNGERRVIGLASWVQPCAVGYPDVFQRVSSFVPWFNGKCNNCLNK